MNPNKGLWEKGDFTAIAAFMRESGETGAESLGLTPQLSALDLGCGDGSTAVPLARLGAEVVEEDIARNLVKAGNKRAAEQGLRRPLISSLNKVPGNIDSNNLDRKSTRLNSSHP